MPPPSQNVKVGEFKMMEGVRFSACMLVECNMVTIRPIRS